MLSMLLMTLLILFGVGLAAIFAVGILTFLYCAPYAFWVGCQNEKGLHLDKRHEPLGATLRNATKLYKSWITRRPAF